MAHSTDKKSTLRRQFIEGLSLKQAALRNGVAYQTALHWKRKALLDGDNWDHARASYRLSSSGVDEVNAIIIEDFTRLYQATVKDVDKLQPMERIQAVSSLADAYTKFVGATAKSSPKFAKTGVALDVLKMVMTSIKKNKPHLFDEFADLIEEIGKEVQAKYEK